MTFFSVLIPTRNRPQFLAYALESLKRQSFEDFEVIVSENSDDHQEGLKLVQNLNDPRFKVVVPNKFLKMDDNWNFALSHAVGRYVTVMTDKNMFLPGAFQKVHKILEKNPDIEVINWMSDWYSFVDEDQGWGGFYHTQEDIHRPLVYNTKQELKFRLAHYIKREELRRHYFRGQIYYGFYSANLIKRIQGHTGKLFHSICPDYTSFILGLLFSRKSYDIGQSLCLMFVTKHSNGNKCSQDVNVATEFQRNSFDGDFEQFIKDLPIPGINYSTANIIGNDYLRMMQIAHKNDFIKFLNLNSLFLRVLDESQIYGINVKDVLCQYKAEKHLKWLKAKKFIDRLKRVTSKFGRTCYIDRVLLKIAKYLPESSSLWQRRQQRLSYNAKACTDPLQGIEFGHAHYKKFKFLEYK